jgi:hypothetical protein
MAVFEQKKTNTALLYEMKFGRDLGCEVGSAETGIRRQ